MGKGRVGGSSRMSGHLAWLWKGPLASIVCRRGKNRGLARFIRVPHLRFHAVPAPVMGRRERSSRKGTLKIGGGGKKTEREGLVEAKRAA
jgi:hypothetical protein